ncbi:hypothetical protein SAMN02745116_02365 [Pilibacter termitis]|uniref:Uncharacterized protein n=1 Tax=Pilibacter termitis TaxID=263852 RepID=A0A1T4QXQ6_9ENTE|nr:hypothetical protein [Pilibacter termitis]SKA08540.1 hypothetical protein SAMN02745116_02365 [Pilibacter termitis]
MSRAVYLLETKFQAALRTATKTDLEKRVVRTVHKRISQEINKRLASDWILFYNKENSNVSSLFQ